METNMFKTTIIAFLMLWAYTINSQESFKLECLIYKYKNGISKNDKWIDIQDDEGNNIIIKGQNKNGFFYVKNKKNNPITSIKNAKEYCQKKIHNITGEKKAMFWHILKVGVRPYYLGGQALELAYPSDQREKIDKIVIFGDSMSDDGNLKHLIRLLPNQPYFAGRFSNGPIWVDILRDRLNLPIKNLAIAGSTANYKLSKEIKQNTKYGFFELTMRNTLSCNVRFEIKNYIQHSSIKEDDNFFDTSLFIIWIGGNDYLNRFINKKYARRFIDEPFHKHGGHEFVVNNTVLDINKNIKILYKNNARKFAIINLPDLGMLPFSKSNKTYLDENLSSFVKDKKKLSSTLTQITKKHNFALNDEISILKEKYKDIDIIYIDIFQELQDLTKEVVITEELTPAITEEICYTHTNKLYYDLDKKLFWDSVHPTAEAHYIIAKFIEEKLLEHFNF